MSDFFTLDDIGGLIPEEQAAQWLLENEPLRGTWHNPKGGLVHSPESIIRDENQYRQQLPTKLNEFLRVLASTGCSVRLACQKTGMSRIEANTLRSRIEKFNRLWTECYEHATDELEDAAFKRAVHGVEEEVYQNGQIVGSKTKYSDSLLAMMLQGRKSEVYQSRSKAEVINKTGIEDLSDEELDKLIDEKIKRMGKNG